MKYYFAFVTFIVGLLLSLILYETERIQENKLRNEFIEMHILERIHAIENEINSTIDMLSLFQHDWDYPYEEFQKIAVPIIKSHPDISNICWLERVVWEEKETFINKIKEKGIKNFNIKELNTKGNLQLAEVRDLYYPVVYSEPSILDSINLSGFNFGQDKKILQAIETAIRNKHTVISYCELIIERNAESGLIVILPVIDFDQDDDLKGIVIMRIDVNSLLSDKLSNFNEDLFAVQLSDITDSNEVRTIGKYVPVSNMQNNNTNIEGRKYSINLYNTKWELNFIVTSELKEKELAKIYLIIGLIITFLVSIYLFIYTNKTNKIKILLENLIENKKKKEIAEKDLKESEERYKAVYRTIPDAVVISSMDGICVDINEGFTKIIGFEREEIIGESFLQKKIWVNFKDRKKLVDTLRKKGECYDLEFTLKRKNGEKFIGLTSAKLIQMDGKAYILSLTKDVSKQKEFDKKILNTIIKTQENERKKIAEDLHDDLGPFLSGIKLYIKELSYGDLEQEKRDSLIDYLNDFVDTAIEKTRSISNDLMPNVLTSYGLGAALNSFCTKMSNSSKINIHYDTNLKKIDNEFLELALYRVSIELINNTIKHANATSISLELKKFGEVLQLNYSDNGKGFSFNEALLNEKGIGIKSIVTRLNSIDAKYRCSGENEKGFSLNIIVNLF